MSLRTVAATLVMTAALSGMPPLAAQPAQPPRPDVSLERQSASETRERLREILNELPPSLGQVLRLDPTLASNPGYLAPYPRLGAFLTQHPEVARNPAFFLGEVRFGSPESPRHEAVNAMKEVAAGIGVFSFFMTALAVISYISRSVLEHRRWLHATKVQTDAHTKLVDRLATNEDLMAYVQSPAGQRFLSATALQVEPDGRGLNAPAPIGRILGSVQIGVVAAFAGLGLWVARNQVGIEEVAQPLSVVSILGISVGIGFVLSALLAWLMSRQLGLLRTTSSNA